jgi:hypothetical protein
MTGLEYIMNLNEVCQFRSTERKPGPCSNSELRRLLDQGALRVNGQVIRSRDTVPLPVSSAVMFPKTVTGRITLL